MKLKNVCVAVVALALAVGMTACGGSASSTAASSSEAASTSTSVAAETEENASSAVAEVLLLRLLPARLLLLRPLPARLLPAKLLLLLPHNQAAHPVQGTIKPGTEFFLCPAFLQQNVPERFIGNLPAHFSEAVIRSRMPLRQRTMLILIFPRTESPVLQRAGSSQWAMVLCPFSGGKGHAAPTAAGTPQWNGDPVQCLPCPLQTRPA